MPTAPSPREECTGDPAPRFKAAASAPPPDAPPVPLPAHAAALAVIPRPPPAVRYDYAVEEIVKVIDGDTVELVVDLGFRMYIREKFRLVGINTAELRARDQVQQEQARAARSFVVRWLERAEGLRVETFKGGTEKYGRWLAVVYDNAGAVLNDDLFHAGLAEIYMPG
jgi:micrococcal nuclease